MTQAFLAFSWYTNVGKMLSIKATPEPLDVLNSLRVLAMAHVVFAHTFLFAVMMRPVRNVDAFLDAFEQPSIFLLYSGYYAVDTFFWMSGLLAGYLMLGAM